MSELVTNKITPSTGSSNTVTLGDSGDTFTIPSGVTMTNSGTATGFGGGKVLQVPTPVQLSGRVTTTSTSYVDITGMTLAITPSATSSKILILMQGGITNETDGWSTFAQMLRDSTVIGSGTGTTREDCIAQHEASSPSNRNYTSLGIMWLDSPSSTSSVTYKLQFRVNGGTGVFGSSGTSGTAQGEVGSHITLMEIGA